MNGKKGTRPYYHNDFERRLNEQAIRLYNEFSLVKSGVLGYADLGYRTLEGQPTAQKVNEFLYIHRLVNKHTPRRQPPKRSGR